MSLLWLVLVLHLLGAVFWVGGMGFALLALRPALTMLEPLQRVTLHAAVLKRFFLIVWHAMPIMLITGYALTVLEFGGFATAPWNVHAMAGLGVLMSVLYLVTFFGPWKAVRIALAEAQLPAAAAAFGRIRNLVTVNFCLGLLTIAIAAGTG